MRYAQIREVDIANGPGIRVSLYTQGCHRHCPFCFNQETWDFNGGKAFTSELEDVLIKLISIYYISLNSTKVISLFSFVFFISIIL